ncbi:hypothetical protein ABGB07_17025 [Micromonosporaceae bacterium B7E4]
MAAKSGLNRSILDAGWGVFLNVLHAKAESAGRVVVEVDPRNTSACARPAGTALRRTALLRPCSGALLADTPRTLT